MKRLCFLIVLAFACMAGIGRASTNDSFAQGVELNYAGRFNEAASAFEKIIERQPSAGALVNLGLAEWQSGHAGAAIRAWEQAQWIDPFDDRAEMNLRFARQVAQVDAPELRWFERASTWLPPDAWVWIAGASLWLAVGALILPRVFRRKKSGTQQTLAALGFCVFICALTANVGVVSRTEIGFVLKKNAVLLLTPTHEGEIISTLNAGEPVRVLRRRADFYFVRTGIASGWLERRQLGLVNPE